MFFKSWDETTRNGFCMIAPRYLKFHLFFHSLTQTQFNSWAQHSPRKACQRPASLGWRYHHHARGTLRKTNKSPWKMEGWQTSFLLGRLVFSGASWRAVSFRDGFCNLTCDMDRIHHFMRVYVTRKNVSLLHIGFPRENRMVVMNVPWCFIHSGWTCSMNWRSSCVRV